MPLVVKDRIRETSVTAGTGTITLDGAVAGFRSFSDIGNGNTTYYSIVDSTAGTWEVGVGTYTSSGATLSRDTVFANSSGTTTKISFSANSKDVFVTYPASKSVYYEQAGGVVIADASTNNALRITQTGTGNALVVEDSTNPDSTPFVIDASGRAIVGHTSALSVVDTSGLSRTPNLQVQGLGGSLSAAYLGSWTNSDIQPSQIIFGKSKSGTVGTNGVVAAGTDIGAVVFSADDGSALIPAASILAEVDGTPGTNDMPGRLVFSTTADGASTPTERMRIDSSGDVGIGTSSPAYPLQVSTAAETNIAITGGTASETNIFFGDSGSATIGRITYNNNGDYMRFNTNAAERMRIDSSGNVGIGTSSPSYKLQVSGSAAAKQVFATNGMFLNSNTISESYTIPSGNNAMSSGQITVESGVTVTVPSDSRWVVV